MIPYPRPHPRLILVVADDLSGAAEIASLAVAVGLTVEVRTDLEDLDFGSANSPRADVLVFDSATRSHRPTDAYLKLKAFATQLDEQLDRRFGCRAAEVRLFKKVDSVLRGTILAELTALAAAGALLLPANPSRGRVIRGGRYYVGDVPLDATVFAADPEYPAITADVRQLLVDRSRENASAQTESGADECITSWLTVHTPPVRAPLPATGLVIPDIDAREPLADRISEWAERGLVAGAADSFAAWIERVLSARAPVPAAPLTSPIGTASPASGHRVFVCGSHAAWTSGRNDQCRAHRIPVMLVPDVAHDVAHDHVHDRRATESTRTAPAWLDWLEAATNTLREHGSLMVALGDHVATNRTSRPEDLAEQHASAVHAIACRVPIEQWLLEGGATASAVVRKFGWQRLAALPMLAPGVTPLRPLPPVVPRKSSGKSSGESSGERMPTVIVKPGSYAWPDSVWSKSRS